MSSALIATARGVFQSNFLHFLKLSCPCGRTSLDLLKLLFFFGTNRSVVSPKGIERICFVLHLGAPSVPAETSLRRPFLR